MQRTLAAALLACAVVLVGATYEASNGGGTRKGIRAILFHAPHLPAPVLLDKQAGAEGLYSNLLRSADAGDVVLSMRPCVHAAVFSEMGSARDVAIDALTSDQADFRVTYYPPVQNGPGIARVPPNRIVQVSSTDAAFLTSLGLGSGTKGQLCTAAGVLGDE